MGGQGQPGSAIVLPWFLGVEAHSCRTLNTSFKAFPVGKWYRAGRSRALACPCVRSKVRPGVLLHTSGDVYKS